MNKEVLVFIFDGYADWEGAFICPELLESKAGYVIRTISLDKNPKISMGGFRVIPDYSVDDFPADFHILILLGGKAWMSQANDAVLPVAEYADEHGIPIAAICNAANFMAEHGFLDHRKHTGNTVEFMKSQAPHYAGEQYFLEEQAVCDSNMVTANGSASLEFAREILRCLKVKPEHEIAEWYRLHKEGFYG